MNRIPIGVVLSICLLVPAAGSCAPPSDAPVDLAAAEDLRVLDPAPWQHDERARIGLAISPVRITGQDVRELDRIGEGSYLINAAGICSSCHTASQGFLAGGIAFPLDGTHVVTSRNLTPDPATGMHLSEAEFIAALRTGADHRNPGQLLLVMPWADFRWMSTEDLGAMYAYLRAIPSVRNAIAPDQKAGSALNGAPLLFPRMYNDGEVARPLPREGNDRDNVQRGLAIRPLATPEVDRAPYEARQKIGRGSYLATVAACNTCHTNPARQMIPSQPGFTNVTTAAYLAGGQVFSVPPPLRPHFGQTRTMSADLTGATHGFLNEADDSFARFSSIITHGQHTDETPWRPLGYPMPWDHFRHLVGNDLQALYAYLKTVPARTGPRDKEVQNWAPFCGPGANACRGGATCNAPTQECAFAACTTDADCFVCQTCSAGKCNPPAADSLCVSRGL